METLTIKLLHERKSRRPHRKCDGMSGKLFLFTWSDEHDAYCYATSSQDEADDLFNSQGRAMGSYFAPVITLAPTVRPKPLSAVLEHELATRGIALPVDSLVESEAVGELVLRGYQKGFADAQAQMPGPTPLPDDLPPLASTLPDPTPPLPTPAAVDPEPVVVRPLKKKTREAVTA